MNKNWELVGQLIDQYPLNPKAFTLQEMFGTLNRLLHDLTHTSDPRLIEQYKEAIIKQRKAINEFIGD